MNSYEDPAVLNHDLLEQIEWFLTTPMQAGQGARVHGRRTLGPLR